jgi:DNA-binding transcriptional regulator GbsR (MarR family)
VTLDELVEKTGIRKGRVRRHLRKLVAKGLVEKVEGKGFRTATKAAE